MTPRPLAIGQPTPDAQEPREGDRRLNPVTGRPEVAFLAAVSHFAGPHLCFRWEIEWRDERFLELETVRGSHGPARVNVGTCNWGNCGQRAQTAGLCNMHYLRRQREQKRWEGLRAEKKRARNSEFRA